MPLGRKQGTSGVRYRDWSTDMDQAELVPWAPSHVFLPWGHVGHRGSGRENERFCWKKQPRVHPGWKAGAGGNKALSGVFVEACCSSSQSMKGWGFCGLKQFRKPFSCPVIFLLIKGGFLGPHPYSFSPSFPGPGGKMGPSSQLTRLR